MTTASTMCRVQQDEALQATMNEGLAQGPIWQLDWDSNLRPSRRKAHTRRPSREVQFMCALQLKDPSLISQC